MQKTQQREHEKQPFFKPLNANSNNSNFFTMNVRESSSESTSNPASFFQFSTHSQNVAPSNNFNGQITSRPRVLPNTVAASPARPQQQIQIQSQQTTGSDKIAILHSRLNVEAEKIQKWKTTTEIEIRQKDKKIIDGQQTIESQRKSILELQLQSENLSAKLQEEMDNRVEIIQKIDATREMCNLLKDHTSKVQEKLSVCKKSKDDLEIQNKENMEHFQELSEQFKTLTLNHNNMVNDLSTKISDVQEENSKIKEEAHLQEIQMKEKYELLKAELINKDQKISEINEQLELKKEQISKLQDTSASLEQKLADSESLTDMQKNELIEAHNQIEERKEDITKLQDVKLGLEDTVNELRDNIMELASARDKLCESMKEFNKTSSEKQCELSQVQEELNKAKEYYEKEKKHDTVFIAQLEAQQHQLQGEISGLRDELKEALEREKNSYDKLDKVRQQLDSTSSEHNSVVQDLQKVTEEKIILENKLEESAEEIDQLKKDVKESHSTIEDLEQTLKSDDKEKKNLKDELADLRTNLTNKDVEAKTKLVQEQKTIKDLDHEISTLTRQTTTLENKNKNLQEQITNKNKQNKELNQELKSFKSQLKSKAKELDKLSDTVDKLQTELLKQEEMAEELSKLKGDLTEKEDAVAALENEVKAKQLEKLALEKETKELRKQTETAVKEHTEAKQSFEHKIEEVSDTLHKYKNENEKIVMIKDKEIEELTQRIEEQAGSKNLMKEKEQCISKLKKKIEMLENEEDARMKEVDKIRKENETQKNKLDKLEKENENKIDELERLGNELDEFKKKLEDAEKEKLMAKCTSAPGKPVPATPLSAKQSSSVMRTPKSTQALHSNTPTTLLKVRPCVKPSTPLGRTPPHKTPQSILKPVGSINKKRRVMFASDNGDYDDDSDSSTSQLMELDHDQIDIDHMVPSQTTSVHLSGSGRKSMAMVLPAAREDAMKPVPRGKPVSRTKKMKPKETDSDFVDSELSKFKKLFPGDDDDTTMYGDSVTQETKGKKTKKNVKKTPKKVCKVKGFGDSPKTPKKKKKNEDDENLSWFDTDAVYGFFDED
ncbi:uncharacterized protein LOC102805622 [Saccoglossus kowalevskii]|uniref:Synaptonemal complex protein 1-like n=1 Tax=Saccoglossus kowalevskii TaxID=10224 RepID=A0ABM0MNC8_SACKO|nr:PREDICTED: synaptonemal complex protein 1-like [Saccoglossus kowalevskii]